MIRRTIQAPNIILPILRLAGQRLNSRLRRRPYFDEIPASSPVHIGKLISPLRYDIIVRKNYFEFFREHRDIFETRLEDYVRMAMRTDYYIWFREIACRRFSPQCLDNESILKAKFIRRLKKAARLHDSYEENGFDKNHPIALRSGRSIETSEAGKRINREIYAGDGCHRIALLMLDGFDEIPRNWLVVRLFDNHKPLDNTFLLIQALNLGKEDYYRFLSLAYADRTYSTRHELLAHLSSSAARDKLAELQKILQADDVAWTKRASNTMNAMSCVPDLITAT